MKIPQNEMRDFLNRKADCYNTPAFIENDPVSIPHLFTKKEDIELAAFFAATLAWGKRDMIIRYARRIMEMMDGKPHSFILHHTPRDLKVFQTFSYRTFQPVDVIYFIKSLKNIYAVRGGLENVFCNETDDVKMRLARFRKIFFEIQKPGRTAKHIANTEKNAAAKRLNLFLRWMVRNDKRGVDFGIWKRIKPAQLYCPLDLHSGRVARKLGLLSRRQDDWKAVDELTRALRKFDPKDPVKYDFALFGLGIFEKF